MGSGAIYPIEWEDVSVPTFQIPAHFPRAYALDPGWRYTAALWCAWDPETWVAYLYSEYKREKAEPTINAAAIKARGEWIQGAIDPAAMGSSQIDGRQMLAMYEGQGLTLTPADNAVEAGLYDVWTGLSLGRIKFMQHLSALRAEYSLYRRDEKGRIVKENDHLLDCLRYVIRSGRAIAKAKPVMGFGIVPQSIGDDRAGY